MSTPKSNVFFGIAAILLALALCIPSSRAESPVLEVALAGHDFVLVPGEGWIGTVTLTINGIEYDGTGVWQISDIKINDNSYHWFANAIYDFGDLGSFEVWEHGKSKRVEPNAGLSGMNRVLGGTGAFEDLRGVLQYLEYKRDGSYINFLAAGHLFFGTGSGD